ncbi:MAG: hypothetical protein ABFD97_23435 [Syntrophobacter sp.]
MNMSILLVIGIFLVMTYIAFLAAHHKIAVVAVKVEYSQFSGRTLHDLNASNGVYSSIEAYKQLFMPDLYIGVSA